MYNGLDERYKQKFLLEQRRRKNVINQLRTSLQNIDRLDLDEAVGLAAQGRMVEAEYAQVGTEAPDWLTDGLKSLRRDIRSRLADTKEKRLLEARSRLSSLATPEEKRKKLEAEIAELEKDLSGDTLVTK